MQTLMRPVFLCVVSFTCVAFAIPVPGFPTIHSFATYDTTRTYLYTKHLGLNYRFLKPARSAPIIPAYTKYISNPYQSQVFVLPQIRAVSSQVAPHEAQTLAPAPQTTATFSEDSNQIQLNSDKDATLSLFLTPPKQDAFITTSSYSAFEEPATAPQVNVVSESDVSPAAKLTVQDSSSDEPSPKENSIAKTQNESDFSGFVPVTTNEDNDRARNEILNETPNASLKNFNSLDDPDLLKLINKISSNGQIAKSSDDTLAVPNASTEVESKPQMESRQDSSVEQPTPFLSSVPKLEPSLNQPQKQVDPQITFPKFSSGRFTLPSHQPAPQFSSTPQQFQNTNSFAGNIPFSRNSPPQILPQPQQNQPQRPPVNGNNGLGFAPNFPQNRPQQFPSPTLQFPGANLLSGPQNPQLGGPAPQEPENGYNPFHLHETYPEPPYESEFADEPPLEDEPSARSHLDQSGDPPALDFAQSTLRNVRTEELLEVTQRKPVPPGCAYNTISYGLNGEDCVERKKRHDLES